MQGCVWKTDMYLVWVRGRVLALRKTLFLFDQPCMSMSITTTSAGST